MTLIATVIATLVATVAYLRVPGARSHHVATLALTYAGASLMWCVDGFASLAAGEPFVELSDAAVVADDTLLGVCVVALGLVTWGIVNLIDRGRKATTA